MVLGKKFIYVIYRIGMFVNECVLLRFCNRYRSQFTAKINFHEIDIVSLEYYFGLCVYVIFIAKNYPNIWQTMRVQATGDKARAST